MYVAMRGDNAHSRTILQPARRGAPAVVSPTKTHPIMMQLAIYYKFIIRCWSSPGATRPTGDRLTDDSSGVSPESELVGRQDPSVTLLVHRAMKAADECQSLLRMR